jgi:hypothetical protein
LNKLEDIEEPSLTTIHFRDTHTQALVLPKATSLIIKERKVLGSKRGQSWMNWLKGLSRKWRQIRLGGQGVNKALGLGQEMGPELVPERVGEMIL